MNSKNSILEVTVGSSFRLPNCDVDSKIPIKEHEYYWMKDGKQKIFVNTTKLIIPDGIPTCCVIPDDRDGTTRSLVPGFPPLTFDRITFADSGRYQCAVHPDGLYQILSTTVHLKVKGMRIGLRIYGELFLKKMTALISKTIQIYIILFRNKTNIHRWSSFPNL